MVVSTDRRLFLQFLGAGLTGAAAGCSLGPLAQARGPMPFAAPDPVRSAGLSFTPILASDADRLVLPPEFDSQVVALWGDALPGNKGRFGYNADFTAFLPLEGSTAEGLLWVNHEYVSVLDEEDGESGVYTSPSLVVDWLLHDAGEEQAQFEDLP